MAKVMVDIPKSSQRYAQRYLEMRPNLPKSKQAMTAAGLREARKTARGEKRDARKIVNWYARHSTYIIPAERKGHTPATSKAIGAHWGWGHWAMLRAAEKAIAKHEREQQRKKKKRASR